MESHANLEGTAIIQEYENLIGTLKSQVSYYENEQTSLKNEVTVLIEENCQLRQQLSDIFGDRCSSLRLESNESETIIDNLKEQLSSSIKEKESAIDLWQKSVRTIEQLEEELKLFHGTTHGYVLSSELQAVKKTCSREKQQVEQKLSDVKLEATNRLNRLGDELQRCNEQRESLLKDKDSLASQVHTLKGEMALTSYRLNESLDRCSRTETSLRDCGKLMETLKEQNEEAKRRVEEALQVAEVAVQERNAALLRETCLKDESARLSRLMTDLMNDSDMKVKAETDKLRKELGAQNTALLKKVKQYEERLKGKEFELELLQKKCDMYREEAERLRKGVALNDDSQTSKMLVLEKSLESTFQKLILSEKRNVQIASERDSVKMDIDQMATSYERDIKSREVEKKTLENKVKLLNRDLGVASQNLLAMCEKLATFETIMRTKENEFTDKIRQKERHFEDVFTRQISMMQKQSTAAIHELHTHLDSQRSLNDKWIKEVNDITSKCNVRIKGLKTENKKLHRALKSMHLSQSKVETQI